MQAPEYKACAHCREVKPASDYNGYPRNHDGLHSYCRPCRSELGVRRSADQRARQRERWWAAEYARIAVRTAHVDPALGNWLAGFADGEGHFAIAPLKNSRYACRFTLLLRDDDAEILELLRDTSGGHLHHERGRRSNQMPRVVWSVGARTEVAFLAAVFRRFPLRAKKRRDCDLWLEGVDEWVAQTILPVYLRDWRRLAEMCDRIKATRRYPAKDPS